MHRGCWEAKHTTWPPALVQQPVFACQALPVHNFQSKQLRQRHSYTACSTRRQVVRRGPLRVRSAAMVDAPEAAVVPEAKLVSYENGTYTVEGTMWSPLPVQSVWRVLTNYEGLTNVFSNIKSSSIASREPDLVVYQDCEWKFLIFSGTFGAELRVNEDRDRGEITFNLVKSSFMNAFVGQWQISPAARGGSDIWHKLTVQPQVSPPPFLAGYTQKIFVSQVTNIMGDLQQELSKHS